MPRFLNLYFISWVANIAAYGEDSSLPAFTLILLITWGNGFLARKVGGAIDESVIERYKGMADAKYFFLLWPLKV